MGKLVGYITPKAERKAYLYGSEPPPMDTIWRAIRRQDIEVRKFQKSFRGKEKEVDTALSFDAGSVANENREKGGTFVIIGGDRDYKYCVERVLECGFLVKLYSWKSCISGDFEKLAKKKERLSIIYLDDIVEECPDTYFFNAEWKPNDIHGSLKPIPAERTIIIQFLTSPNYQTKKQIAAKKEIESVTQRLGIFFYYHWTWGSSADREYAANKKTAGNIISGENDGKRQRLIIFGPRESSDLTEDEMDELTLQYLIENNYIDIEGHVKNLPKSKKLYDFTEILLKNKNWLRQHFAKFGDVEDVTDYVSFHNQASPDIPSASNEQEIDEDGGDFTVAGVRSRKKIYQMSSNPCENGRRCPQGVRCRYKHTIEDREYFKKCPNGKTRMTRKTSICIDYLQKTEQHLGIKGCRFSIDRCNYAHGVTDAYCYTCGAEGDHFADDCPSKKS
uniref:C3H1-type domain-containing protein n=1 Tax=Plectus sambesii TaxID=2011161 RepID=A0A914VQY9_9BILA